MGFRSVIIINNDVCHNLRNDPEIGGKILNAIDGFWVRELNNSKTDFGIGTVVQETHADNTTLSIIGKNGAFTLEDVAATHWNDPNPELSLLKQFADSLGYKIVKK